MPELVGLARTMRSLAAPVATARDDLVDTAGTGGGPSTFNVSTTAALVAAGGRLRGRQARQPLQHQPLRLRRPARGARRRHRARRPSRSARCIDEVGFGFMFAPRHHAAMAHVVPVRKELGGADDLQLPRPADQPGRRRRASCSASPTATTRRRSPRRWSASAASGRWSSPPRTALDELSISAPTRVIEVADGAHRGVVRRAGRVRPRAGRAGGRRRRHPGGERRRRRAPCSTASRARSATSSCSTPAPRSTSAARADDLEAGVAKAAEAIDSGAARSVLERLIAATAGRRRLGSLGPVGMIEQLISAAREGVERAPRASSRRPTSRRGSHGRGEDRPFSEALVRPGLSLIAEFKRRSPSAGEIAAGGRRRRPGRRLRARRRGGALGAHRRGATSAARSRTCAPPARPATCRSCARTSSSTPTSSTRRRSTAPTRCC